VGHAGVLRVLHCTRFGRIHTVLGFRGMRVIVRRNSRVRQGRRTTTSAALAGELSQLLDGRLTRSRFDVRYAVARFNVDARDMRMSPQTFLQELDARGAAPASDWDGQRFYVVPRLRRVNRWCTCHGMNTGAAT